MKDVQDYLSVVTINYNNYYGLAKTIESIERQDYQDFEYIIIDGDSNDGSPELIRNIEKKDARFIIEEDGGIYNAMNKGVIMSNGNYIMFLNSGDYLYSNDTIRHIVSRIGCSEVIYGDICAVRGRQKIRLKSPENIEFSSRYQHSLPPQPSTIVKKDVLISNGCFNERYKIAGDVEILSKILIKASTSTYYLDRITTVFDESGVSSKKRFLAMRERVEIVARLKPAYILPLITEIACIGLKWVGRRIKQ
jgi:glycosyltransferase involved in cell wall biosynthesis